eukprot:symbB.v1.2.009381.t1/scaffold595.1/size183375/3
MWLSDSAWRQLSVNQEGRIGAEVLKLTHKLGRFFVAAAVGMCFGGLNYCYYAWPSYSLDGLRTYSELDATPILSAVAFNNNMRLFQILALLVFRQLHGAVTSDRWRLVGRDVGSTWVVQSINFYTDGECTTAIQARPFRSLQGNGIRHDGSAFSGPNVVHPTGFPADAFEASALTWETGVPCASTGESCFIGFQWLSDQIDTAGGYATTGGSGRLRDFAFYDKISQRRSVWRYNRVLRPRSLRAPF